MDNARWQPLSTQAERAVTRQGGHPELKRAKASVFRQSLSFRQRHPLDRGFRLALSTDEAQCCSPQRWPPRSLDEGGFVLQRGKGQVKDRGLGLTDTAAELAGALLRQAGACRWAHTIAMVH